jgi:RNA-directed DNA polymerase
MLNMIAQVTHSKNMHKAYQQVLRTKGSAGIDGMHVGELRNYVKEHKEAIVASLLEGSYKMQPILGVQIPKSNGKMRLLGIPTVVDRWLQQSVSQAIAIHFEEEFKEHSYGFRPNKSGLDCVQQSQQYIHEGYQHIVDIDLKNFFDEVNHCKLLQLLYEKVKCATTLRLIRKWLRAPILIDGKLIKRRKGVPQGSPLSPLLSKIMLHELDKELERMDVKYVRYADDFSIYCKSKRQARETGNKIYLFLRATLKLEINREKSGLRKPVNFEILGYAYVPLYAKGVKGKYQLVVTEKRWKTLKEKLKLLTRKTSPIKLSERLQRVNEVQRGWLNYFCLASIHGKLKSLDGWLRNRLRYCIWHDWKKPERRRKNLIRLGVSYDDAYAWSRTRMGGWRVAQSPILTTTVTLKRLQQRGYVSMLDYYLKIAPQLNEPLYTRPVRTVV